MGLKFRRGTTAQKSGSLAFGEPYVNTDLGTLQIGGASGDITLGASGTGSAGTFSSISGSGLDITGNANIGGNLTIGGAITIGDNVSDTVNVVASLSSSLIPSTTNVFDLGTTSKLWKDVYIASGSNGIKFVDGVGATVATLDARIVGGYDSAFTTFSGMVQYIVREDQTNNFTGSQFVSGNLNITGSIIPGVSNEYDLGDVNHFFRDLYISTGSIKMVSNGVVVSTLSNTGNGMLLDQGITANGNSTFGTSSAALTSVTGSFRVSGSASVIGALSASTITGIGNVSLYSTSVDSRLVAAEAFSSSLDSTFATDASVTIISASAWGAFQSASSYSASIYTRDANQDTNITTVSASAWGAFQSASSYSGSFATRLAAAEAFSSSLDSTFATDASVTALSSSVKLVTDTFATSASVASATAASITALSSSVFLVDATQTTNITTAQNSAAGAFASASAYSASAAVIDNGQDVLISSLRTNILSASVYNTFSTSVASRVNTLETAGYAVSSSVASATAASITTLSGSVKGVTDALSGRVTTLEGKDISITLTGDVTGTGTITDLANVSFATTIAANSVALGTDTTGDYVASLVQGTGVTITNNSGEGATPTISIGQAVATNSAVAFASVSATGDIVAYSGSDKRLKNNIINISDAVTKVRKLNGVTWKWNDDVNEVTKTAPTTGLIAQEVQEVLPEVVNEREDGYLGIDYSKMVGLLVEAIKEQQNQIDSLTIEIENLKKNNSL